MQSVEFLVVKYLVWTHLHNKNQSMEDSKLFVINNGFVILIMEINTHIVYIIIYIHIHIKTG